MSIAAVQSAELRPASDADRMRAAVTSLQRVADGDLLEHENARLAALDNFDVLDTPREDSFDRVVRLTKALVGVPIALLSFIDAHRQWFKACHGLASTEAPRKLTFCNHVIRERQPVVVPDATRDPRFSTNPFVTGEPFVRAYVGVPLRTSSGHEIGTLCAVDLRPREFGREQVALLTDLARMTVDYLELRLAATTDNLTGALSRPRVQAGGKPRRGAGATPSPRAQLHRDGSRSPQGRQRHLRSCGRRHRAVRAVQACSEQLRRTDLMGRMGGEEFAVLLPNTGTTGALEVGEKLQARRRDPQDRDRLDDHRALRKFRGRLARFADARSRHASRPCRRRPSRCKAGGSEPLRGLAPPRERGCPATAARSEGRPDRLQRRNVEPGLHGAQPFRRRRRPGRVLHRRRPEAVRAPHRG